MDGLSAGGSDGNVLDFLAQRLGGAGESGLNDFGYLGGVGDSSTENPHDRWGQHSSYWSHGGRMDGLFYSWMEKQMREMLM